MHTINAHHQYLRTQRSCCQIRHLSNIAGRFLVAALLEHCSQLIMKSPKFAAENGMCAMMWRKCFYDHISMLRRSPEKEVFQRTLGEAKDFYTYVIEKVRGQRRRQ